DPLRRLGHHCGGSNDYLRFIMVGLQPLLWSCCSENPTAAAVPRTSSYPKLPNFTLIL
ncbi:hypothetical protein HAX54_003188, partial [Datura stramonium]|nr:hypothetical protein [Datura stramonium]